MLKIDSEDEYRILLTRGDRGCIRVRAYDEVTNDDYIFQPGDKVSFVAVPKKGYTEGDVLRIDVFVEEESDYVNIDLLPEHTKLNGMINKKVTYWYNVVLNDDQTIIGSDEDGEKVLVLYPEVGEGNE